MRILALLILAMTVLFGFASNAPALVIVGVILLVGLSLAWRPKRASAIVGEARGLQERSEQAGVSTFTIVSFRVDRYDPMGNRLPPVPVQMRGLRFNGTINEGDRVEIDQRWRRGEMLCPSRVRDLTTGVTVRSVVGPGYRFGVVFGWLIFLLIIAALLGLLVRLVWG